MDIFRAIVLGLVQGATEFLPISSSAHLVLLPWLLGWEKPSLEFDTIVHWGTLSAVLSLFWRDLLAISRAWLRGLFRRRIEEDEAKLAWFIIIGTIPGVLAGAFLEDFFESLFGSPSLVALMLLVTGLILSTSELIERRWREREPLTFLDSFIIGVAQACAISPGISRSGATIAMGLICGLKREEATRFSFLLSTPIILGAGLLQLVNLFRAGEIKAQFPLLLIGFLTSTVSGWLCIKFLLSYLKRGRLYPFAIYCWLAGFFCYLIFLLRG
jgi:undecaprenyl-diphosphatase